MKTVQITIEYSDSKTEALKMYLSDCESTVEKELTVYMDTLWEKYVPGEVRSFIERNEAADMKKKKRARGGNKAVCGDIIPGGTDTAEDGENAT